MGVCSICASLKNMGKSGRTDEEIKNYIMPTTGILHLSNNFTRHEVYQAYKDDMLLESVPYIQYCNFNQLWRL